MRQELRSGARGAAERVTDLLGTCLRILRCITVQTRDNMESLCFIYKKKSCFWGSHLCVCLPLDHK